MLVWVWLLSLFGVEVARVVLMSVEGWEPVWYVVALLTGVFCSAAGATTHLTQPMAEQAWMQSIVVVAVMMLLSVAWVCSC